MHRHKLEEANNRYEFLCKSTGETIWERDLHTNEIVFGGGYEKIFGTHFPDNKLTFDEWKKLVHPSTLKKTLECMEETLANKNEKFWECDYIVIRSDGETAEVSEKAYVIYDKSSSLPVKVIGSTRNITEMKKNKIEKDKLIDDLMKRNKVLEQFTFMVSHNLRALIANMMGIIDLMKDESLADDVKEDMYELNRKSVIRLNDVVRDMNEILNIKKNIDEDKVEVVFNTVLSEINDIIMSIIKNTDIKITSDFSKAPKIYSIKSYIYSIFQNLITNSIKYRQDGSSFIKISSDEDDEYTYLTFEDDGLGIDMQKHKDKIFGLYKRFDLSKEGKGIGLFMVKNEVEDLDGEINVESEVNVGTKFFIKFKK